jgi:hypothetical protein
LESLSDSTSKIVALRFTWKNSQFETLLQIEKLKGAEFEGLACLKFLRRIVKVCCAEGKKNQNLKEEMPNISITWV